MKRPQNYATIRLDEKLRDRIKKLAEAEHRSFMAEVTVLLEEALAQRDKASENPPRRRYGIFAQKDQSGQSSRAIGAR